MIIILFTILIINNNEKSHEKSENINITSNCTSITNHISSGEDTIIFYDNGNFREDIDSIITDLKNEYNLNNIYKIEENSNCLDEMNTNEEVKTATKDESLVMLYKNKSLIGFSTVNVDYSAVEIFLKENSFIKDERQEETVSLDEIKAKLKKENYILFIVNRKSEYNEAVEIIKDYNDYEYDIIFYNGIKGEEIYKYLLNNYNITNEIPEFIYFKNNKVIINDTFDKTNFKEQMDKFKS